MKLLEREKFTEQLHRSFEIAAAGEGRCLFVTGEAGIGKSSLVKQFLQTEQNRSAQFMGYCDALFTPRPLAPLHDIVLKQNPKLPAFFHEGTRSTLFASFTEYLFQQSKTIVLVFEDIHWADEGTLDFIKYFARRIHNFRCLFILTWRDNEIHNGHPLYNVLGDLPPEYTTRLQLPPLSTAAVQQLAEERDRNGAYIFKISGGNPFFVHELLNSAESGLPQNIREAVLVTYNREPEAIQKAWQLLSLMPEGIELGRIALFSSAFGEALNKSLEKKILVLNNERVFFKHELFRLAVASTITAILSNELHRQVLHILLSPFIKHKEWSRIVHYAQHAGDAELILTYAPKAAAYAASVGAHAEAARLYITALSYTPQNNTGALLPLYEAYAYECYLTNQFNEAIAYTGKVLQIHEERGDKELTGKSLRFLSRLWWFQGNHAETEKYALAAIDVLKDQQASSAKAMAYSNLSQLYMLQKKKKQCLFWGNQAIEMARALNDFEILSHALNNTGSAQLVSSRDLKQGQLLLEESLQLALTNGYHEHAARAYTNLISISVAIKEFDLAMKYMEAGLCYCEERDLDSWTTYKLSWKARLLLETCQWQESLGFCQRLLRNEQQPPIVKIGALVITSTIRMRQNELPVTGLLNEAKDMAFATEEHQRIIPVIVALLELEWLTGEVIISEENITYIASVLKGVDEIHETSEFAFWMQLARGITYPGMFLYEPYKLLRKGKIAEAAIFWQQKNCLYQAALALFMGNEAQKREALKIAQQLNAVATVRKMQHDMRSSGIKSIPRGKRKSTLSNPAQLTGRELEILRLLKRAASNKEISEALFISPKTVDHHISSILLKLDVASRSKAVAKAFDMGIINEG